jgi:hypothetical protein
MQTLKALSNLDSATRKRITVGADYGCGNESQVRRHMVTDGIAHNARELVVDPHKAIQGVCEEGGHSEEVKRERNLPQSLATLHRPMRIFAHRADTQSFTHRRGCVTNKIRVRPVFSDRRFGGIELLFRRHPASLSGSSKTLESNDQFLQQPMLIFGV